jgi:hypothetical protein
MGIRRIIQIQAGVNHNLPCCHPVANRGGSLDGTVRLSRLPLSRNAQERRCGMCNGLAFTDQGAAPL